jgi:TPR repeat protein
VVIIAPNVATQPRRPHTGCRSTLGPDGLTIGLLNRVTGGEAIVVATMRSEAREIYRPRRGLRPPEWEVLEAFTRIDLKRRHTPAELDRIQAAVTDPDVLAAVQQYGLAEYLGAGPQAVDKFESGETTRPLGQALVRAAIDWRRSGLARPIPRTVLATPTVASIYLADRPEEPRTQEALEQAIEWATEEINETVALLGRRFTEPADAAVEGFAAFDYLVDYLAVAGAAIPEQLWQLSLTEAQPTELDDIGYVAVEGGNLPVAEHAFGRAAKAGDSGGMVNLGILLHHRGELDEAETWWRRAAEAGSSAAMFNLGVLLKNRGETAEAETLWRRVMEVSLGVPLDERGELDAETLWRREAEAGNSEAMFGLALLLHERGELDEAETWWRRAAEAGNSGAMTNVGCCSIGGARRPRPRPGTGGRPRVATSMR